MAFCDVTKRMYTSPMANDWVVEFLLSSCFCNLIGLLDISLINELICVCVCTHAHVYSHFFSFTCCQIPFFHNIVIFLHILRCCDCAFVLFASSTAYCECTESDRGRYRMRGSSPIHHRSTSITALKNASAPSPLASIHHYIKAS